MPEQDPRLLSEEEWADIIREVGDPSAEVEGNYKSIIVQSRMYSPVAHRLIRHIKALQEQSQAQRQRERRLAEMLDKAVLVIEAASVGLRDAAEFLSREGRPALAQELTMRERQARDLLRAMKEEAKDV